MLFFAYILIGILFWRLVSLANRVDALEFGLARLRSTAPIQPPPAWEPIITRPTPARPEPVPAPPVVDASPEAVEIHEPELVQVYEPESEPVPEPPFTPEPEPLPVSTTPNANSLEELIGGNILNKLGALVLVIGIALFLSYSFANMGPAGRVGTGVALSAVLLAGGAFVETKERYKIAARGLIASGWAGLYFTSYASFAVGAARVIDNAFIGTLLMTAVAAGAVLHSLRYKTQALTALAFGCIFAAFALSDANTLVAIALIPLAASMLYLARRFDWHELALFAAAGTYGVFLTRPDTGAPLASIQAMLFVFWTLFEAFDLLRLHSKKPGTSLQNLLFGINALAGLIASGVLWFHKAPESMWMFCVGASGLYLASTWLRYALDGETLYEFSLAISAVLAGLAIFAKVEGIWAAIGLMVEAEALFLLSWRLRIPVAKALSWLGFLAALRQIFDHLHAPAAIIGGLQIEAITPPLLILAALLYLNRKLSRDESYWSYFASGIVTFAIARQTESLKFLNVAWLAWATLLFEFGLRKRLQEFRIQGYLVAILSTIPAIGMGVFGLAPEWTLGVAAGVFFAQALRARQLPELSARELRILSLGSSSATTLLTGLLIHTAVPVSYEGIALLATSAILIELGLKRFPADLLRPAVLMNAAALLRIVFTQSSGIIQSPEPQVAIAFGGTALIYYWFTARLLRSREPVFELCRTTACIVGSLAALITIWMLVPGAFVPLGFAALALLLIEAGVAQSAADVVWTGRAVSLFAASQLLFDAPAAPATRIGIASAIAAYHYLTRFRLRSSFLSEMHGLLATVIVTGTLFNEVSGGMLTLAWSLEGIGLLAAGFALRDRWLRLPGLGLLLLCIGKVFFYDLRNLETMYRILSFIGLGLILLGVSFIYTRFKEQLQKLL